MVKALGLIYLYLSASVCQSPSIGIYRPTLDIDRAWSSRHSSSSMRAARVNDMTDGFKVVLISHRSSPFRCLLIYEGRIVLARLFSHVFVSQSIRRMNGFPFPPTRFL
ncbi:hypothetical protein CSUI_009779 [Cystoisospora suis]|uniref:Secreted protein n=1 Tax=Cystoisospora suis TaxID=483139 RepID=A0A2C6KJ17_9APIC|nr:hypothetical protein CSUI_009779 [Cystoisospora suis]